jgi:hypothetical protein
MACLNVCVLHLDRALSQGSFLDAWVAVVFAVVIFLLWQNYQPKPLTLWQKVWTQYEINKSDDKP